MLSHSKSKKMTKIQKNSRMKSSRNFCNFTESGTYRERFQFSFSNSRWQDYGGGGGGGVEVSEPKAIQNPSSDLFNLISTTSPINTTALTFRNHPSNTKPPLVLSQVTPLQTRRTRTSNEPLASTLFFRITFYFVPKAVYIARASAKN